MSRRRRVKRPAGPVLPADPRAIDWQAVDWGRVDRCLARFDGDSLAVLLAAAADSPGGGHRLPSLSVLWLRCLARPPAGTVLASAQDLPRLLAGARAAAPQLRVLEDCWPADPRLLARYPVAGQRFRVHPGSLTDPVLTLRNVAATAEAIDGFVRDRHRFGLTDLAEVALRYCDYRMGALSGAWPVGGLARDGGDPGGESLQARVRRIARTPVTVTDAEMYAARPVGTDPEQWIAACESPVRAAAAWEWATRPAAAVQVNLAPGGERVGAVLAVRSQGHDWPVPASLVIGAVAMAAAGLAREAAGDEHSQHRMQLVTERRALGAFGNPVAAQPGAGGQQEPAAVFPVAPVAVTVPASRHAFVVGFASGLNDAGLARSLREAAAAVGGLTADMIRAADSEFDASGMVFRVVIHGGPVPRRGPVRRGVAYVHVDDLITAALDADQAVTGDHIGRELLWQFLDELASMPGVGKLAAWDFADIWQVWLDRGVLNPGGLEGITLYPVVVPGQESWERTAAWEPLETVLTRAGLPPSWEWSYAHLDEPGQATVGHHGHLFLLLAEPPLILHVPAEKGLAAVGVDPAFAVGVADGIRLTAQRAPGVSAAMTSADGTPLLCHLHLEAHRSAGVPADAVGCRLAADSGPPPAIDLVFGTDWLEFLAEDPAGGHAVLGRAMAEGLRQALHLPGEACQGFLDSWFEAVPVAALRQAETTLPPSFQGRDRLPRSPATAARARRAIATAIVRSDVPQPAMYVGEGAAGLCKDVILPGADAALGEAIADWSPATILAVARCLNDAHADRARRATELAYALAAPWGPNWQSAALDAPEPAMITRPLELLLETLLARTPAGTGTVAADAFEIAEAADLAGEAISAGLYLAATRHRLHDLAIAVHDGGQFTITDMAPEAAAAATIDMAAYLQADRADRLRLRPGPLTGTPARLTPDASSRKQDFEPLKDLPVPPSLLTADAIMKKALGAGTDGLRAVLGTAVTWTPSADDVAEVTRAQLRDAAAAWAHLPLPEIDAAIGLLSLTPAQLQEEGLPYWEQERRTYRLATRPLICPEDDRLILIPRRIAATQELYAAYLLDGRLPWPPTAAPRAVADAFNNFRNRRNRELERQVQEILSGLGIPFQGNIEPHHAAPAGLQLTGEIDALAADPRRSRLWVCEVKDVTTAASPRIVADRVRKFTDPGGYVSKLLRSLREVQAAPGAAAQLIKAPQPDRNWAVLPLMITRHVEPAAFAADQAVAFVVVEDLAAFLQSDFQLEPGHAAPPGSPTTRAAARG